VVRGARSAATRAGARAIGDSMLCKAPSTAGSQLGALRDGGRERGVPIDQARVD